MVRVAAYYWSLAIDYTFSIVVIRDTMASQDITEDEKTAQEIGEIVQHSNKVVYIASYYGRPLEYLGELSGSYWPRKISDTDRILRYEHPRSVKERLDTLDFFPEYFVITDFKEFNRHHADLKKYLINHCSLLVENDKYIIYSVCRG